MSTDGIPEFLRIPADVRAQAWKDHPPVRVSRKEAAINWRRPRTWSATAEALERNAEAHKVASQKARLAALRERDE